MRKLLKRMLSVFLAFAIVFLSAGVGIGELDFVVKTKAVSENDLTFQLNFDEASYSVVDCNESAEGEVIIPEMYNNLPVIRIGREAFKNCKKITSVTVGNRITTIGDSAFENCSFLEYVKFPDNVIYSQYSTMIVNDCQDVDDWKMSDSAECEADFENYISGSQSIHSSSGAMVCRKDTYDMLNNNLVLNLRINSMSDGARLYMQIRNSSDASKYATYELMRGHSTTPMGSWREITVPYTGYSAGSFDKIDYTKIDYIKFYVTGGSVDWNLQYIGVKPIVADKGVVSFTFDDGYKSQYTGLEILGKKGVKGTLFYIPEANTNGSADYLKINDLQELVKLYGTDIEVHGASSYNDKTDEELIAHWENAQKLFKENGLGEGRHMAYPNGMHEDRVVKLAKNYFDSCRTIQYYIPAETYAPADKYRIRAISSIGASGNNVDSIKNKIDRAKKAKSWLILVFHRIEDGNTSMYCSESDLAAIADYAIESGVEIKTIAEVMDSTASIGDSKGSISVGEYAFYSCENLKSVIIPESVSQIDEKAFGYIEQGGVCEKLDNFEAVGIKNSVAHNYCKNTGLQFDIICESHIFSDWITDKDSTCVEEGLKYTECTYCEDVLETEKIEKKEHIESGWLVDKDASCTEEGFRHKECTQCKGVLETETIERKEHTAGSWKTEKKATVNSAGKKVKKCTGCGKTLDIARIAQLKCSKPTLKKIENTEYGVKITWGKVSGADKYYVYRKTSSGKYTRIGTTTKTYYTDKKASSGKKYYYIVKAVNEAGGSDSSSSKSIVYLADPTLKTPKSTKKGIVLKWSKVSGADGYMVYRKTGSGSYSKIATVKGNSKVTYTDKKAKKGKTYTYKVKAYKSKTYSVYSNTKTIKDKY